MLIRRTDRQSTTNHAACWSSFASSIINASNMLNIVVLQNENYGRDDDATATHVVHDILICPPILHVLTNHARISENNGTKRMCECTFSWCRLLCAPHRWNTLEIPGLCSFKHSRLFSTQFRHFDNLLITDLLITDSPILISGKLIYYN